ITFVTGNPNKLIEARMIMEAWDDVVPVELRNLPLDLPEIQGCHLEISRAKCRLAAEAAGGAVVVEDTALCFNSLNGMPGPYIKWFVEAVSNEGLYKMLAAHDDKSAYAQCALSFCMGPGHEPFTFVGRADGTIVAPKGDAGFGWDKIMKPHGSDRTFAEMAKEDKNKISH
ncbi:unnamed protein product, partial [Phaeothamnion confervicola]